MIGWIDRIAHSLTLNLALTARYGEKHEKVPLKFLKPFLVWTQFGNETSDNSGDSS